jgi:hypothetical protein
MTRLLIRLVNWLVFKAWHRAHRWLWMLYRAALVVAFLLALLALLVTVCRQGLSDRSEDTGPPPWTTRVWAADRAGGVTIRATTGRATPDSRVAAPVAGSVLFAVLLLLVVLASGAAILAGVIICHSWLGASGAVMGLVKVRTGVTSVSERSGRPYLIPAVRTDLGCPQPGPDRPSPPTRGPADRRRLGRSRG